MRLHLPDSIEEENCISSRNRKVTLDEVEWSVGDGSDTGHWLPKFQILSINQTGLPQNLSPQQNVSLDLRLGATIAELNLGPHITFPRYHKSISNIISIVVPHDHLKMWELFQELNIIVNQNQTTHGLTVLEIGNCIQQIINKWKLSHPHSSKSKPPEAWI